MSKTFECCRCNYILKLHSDNYGCDQYWCAKCYGVNIRIMNGDIYKYSIAVPYNSKEFVVSSETNYTEVFFSSGPELIKYPTYYSINIDNYYYDLLPLVERAEKLLIFV